MGISLFSDEVDTGQLVDEIQGMVTIYFRFERRTVLIGRDGGSLIGRDGTFQTSNIIFSANAP